MRALAAALLLAAAAPAAARPLAAVATTGRGARGPARRAIADDWPRALAEAKARKVPLVVDVWAPW